MDVIEYREALDTLRKQISALTEYPEEKREETARDLENLSFTFTLGDLDINLFRYSCADFTRLLDSIDKLSVTDIEDNPTIFDPPQNRSQTLDDWGRKTKIRRAEILFEKFLFLQKLRGGDPEAWDEVNELFYDD